MPIIVDKRKGQRSVHIVNNKPNIMEDLIQALRGLNFKFEVNFKILDVTKDESGEELKRKVSESSKPDPVPDMPNQQEQQQQQQQFVESNNINKLNEMLNQDLITRSPILSQQAPIRAEPKPERVEPKVLSPQPTPPPTPQQPQLVDPVPEQPNTEPVRQPIKYSRADILQAVQCQSSTPIKEDKTSLVPRLIKGSLNVGGTVQCPCLAVEPNASESIAYIAYDAAKLYELSRIITENLDVESLPIPESISVGDIVFAQSFEDGCWYRAVIESCSSDKIVIFFFDWGLREKIQPANYKLIRYLEFPEVGLSKFPACAMRVKFNSLTIPEVLSQFLRCESQAEIKVLAYDVDEDTYTVHVTLL